MIKLPGISMTLGMTQGDHQPYARVRGRSGLFSASKNIDLSSGKGLLVAVGALLLTNAVKKTAAKSKTKAKPKAAAKPAVAPAKMFPF